MGFEEDQKEALQFLRCSVMSVLALATWHDCINSIQHTTRNSDAAISHSSPFSLLVNKPGAVCILYSRPGLSSAAHMKALWLCFALACFQCQTAPGSPGAHWKPQLWEGGSGAVWARGEGLSQGWQHSWDPPDGQWMARLWAHCYLQDTLPAPALEQQELRGMAVFAARAALLTLDGNTWPSPCMDKFMWLNWSGTRHMISSGKLKID